ncbi:MAG: hypothetical protein HFE85_00245 [Clostridiales bacterium]|nr:hypothetical protein [Clostridiales bacterium]
MSEELRELSEEYQQSARLLNERIEQLREELKCHKGDDRLYRRLAGLYQMRDEVLLTARNLREYYSDRPSPSLKH